MDGRKVERDELSADQFKNWIAWAKSLKIGMDFNQTYFSHPMVKDGMTLTHPDKSVRKFWIEHGIRSREIGAAIGKALGKTCLTNLWIPDGMKDTPADRRGPRERLVESLDAVFKKRLIANAVDRSSPSSLAFGAESYTPGSTSSTSVTRQPRHLLTLDAGPYHPTEGIADKISSVLCYLPEFACTSAGGPLDSDHVVTLTDDLQAIAPGNCLGRVCRRVRIGWTTSTPSINRVARLGDRHPQHDQGPAAGAGGPIAKLKQFERDGDYTSRLALMEDAKVLPFGAVWDYSDRQKRRSPSAMPGLPKSNATNATCCPSAEPHRLILTPMGWCGTICRDSSRSPRLPRGESPARQSGLQPEFSFFHPNPSCK
jgi:L-rhamnose isomerase